jgi:magnesium-protoporphyrin IX monomethyl ester (oxidative) cyclase
VEELGQLHKKGRKKLIKIWDANFFGDINRVEKICYLMLERGLTKFKIWTEARVDDIIRAQPILRDLYRVGLRSVSLGLESPLPQTLRLMKKSITIDKCQEAVAILRKYWIKPQGYFIIGHHSETEEDTKRYPEYAEKLWLHNTVFMAMTPYPGTEVFEEYSRQNLIRSFNWDLYNNFVPVVETRSIDLKTLRRLYAYCYGKFYLDRFLLAKCRNFPDTIASLLGRLHMIHLIARMNTETTREECKDFMYEAVRTGVGRRFQTALQPKFSLMLALFRSFTIRIKRSPGRQVDIKISSAGKGRNYFIAETQEAGPVKGPVLDLEEIIGLGDRISPRRLTELDNESEILKLSSGLSRVTGRIFLNEFFSHSDLIFLAVFFLKHIGNAFLRVLCYPFSKA